MVLREEDVAWHDPWRFDIARHLLSSLVAASSLHLLGDQTSDYGQLHYDLERSGLDHNYLEGAPRPNYDIQGRGGAAVWRAERKLALEHLVARLVETGSADGQVGTSPWSLTTPAGWRRYRFATNSPLPPQQQSDLNAGQVLKLEAGR